ncbi:trimeric intracellular cation channel family protein [Hoeflea poritis]|uniref:Trimeric intracellular cation channel family protein n=1 Tax=Hoeflea poritis TaxID=2993659 RepID=A0ABT4VM01_9HYPH|nr:trimeric intracellular cation channel family protein [Hoeflea poritis]MDA4845190.1 trimeric intracellular cation channel family protein [Hoeflea poritis]
MTLLTFLDYTGVAVFAATGALAASRKQLDIIGFLFFACATGVGGGTLRDLILGLTPVFWVREHLYLLICVAVAILIFFTAHRLESRYRWLLWLDAAGLAVFSVMGAVIGLSATGSPVVAVVTGVLTATFGGVLRDLVSGEPTVLMRREIYVTAALLGALVFVLAVRLGLGGPLASVPAFLAAFILRGGAIRYGWTLPSYRNTPGRPPDDLR